MRTEKCVQYLDVVGREHVQQSLVEALIMLQGDEAFADDILVGDDDQLIALLQQVLESWDRAGQQFGFLYRGPLGVRIIPVNGSVPIQKCNFQMITSSTQYKNKLQVC